MPVDPFLLPVQELENPGDQEASDPFQDEVTDPFEEDVVSEEDAALVNELLEAQEAAENSEAEEAIVSIDPGEVETMEGQLDSAFNPLFLLALIPVLAVVLFFGLRKPKSNRNRRDLLDRQRGHKSRQRFREKIPPKFDDQPVADAAHDASGPHSAPEISDPSFCRLRGD